MLVVAEVVEAQDDRGRGAGERQELHEAGEAVVDEGAVEHRLRAGGLADEQPRGDAQYDDGEPAGDLALAVVVGAEHAPHQQRHGADDDDQLGPHRRILGKKLHLDLGSNQQVRGARQARQIRRDPSP